MTDYYVRYVSLPKRVEGVTIPNDDGSFDIYINSRLSPARRRETLEHELRHIRAEHFYLEMPIERMERQAEGEAINTVLRPPAGKIPCFSSEAALSRWLDNLCQQQHIQL
ncbi:MAG: ImmA/IrrE family metallo-endopeptidase [Oscillospiraceae bacterium]|nr:ImmA/IrrE family metallo-endopeptidase [Oscillospiraceae bacterium]